MRGLHASNAKRFARPPMAERTVSGYHEIMTDRGLFFSYRVQGLKESERGEVGADLTALPSFA